MKSEISTHLQALPMAPAPRRDVDGWLVLFIVLLGVGAMSFINPYAVKLLGKVYVLWIIVLGLQLLIAHTGVLTLGQAAFVAVVGYVSGGLVLAGLPSLWLMLLLVALASATLGAVVGALVLRTQGLYQLMATLAVGQMIYYGLQSLRSLGGDDGFALKLRPTLWAGWGLESEATFGVAIVLIAALAAWLIGRIKRSEMGYFMQAARDDERKLAALGMSPYAVRLCAFVVAAVFAGIGGALLAQLTRFTSPQIGHWMMSGELMVLVLLGGASTRYGTFLACCALVVVQQVVAQYTDHWPLVLGGVVLLRVLWPTKSGGRT